MAPSPALDRVDSRGPRFRFYSMHRQRHPYGSDHYPQAQHSHRHNGHRMHPQQYNLDDQEDDTRSVNSEQSSSMVPSAASPRSEVPTFSSYRRVSAPLPSTDPDATTAHHGHPPSAIQLSPSPPRSALHYQPRLHGRFYPLAPDSAFGRSKSVLNEYPFQDAKMPRGFSETSGEESQSGTAAFHSAPPSASFAYVLNSGLGPRKLLEGQHLPAVDDTNPQETAAPAAIASSKGVMLPPSSTPLTAWRDPLSAPPSSSMAVSELAPAPSPEPFSRGGRRPVGASSHVTGGTAYGTQNYHPLKGQGQEGKGQQQQQQQQQQQEEEEEDQDEGLFAQEGGRGGQGQEAAAGGRALNPGTEPRHHSSAEAPHDARTPSHVLRPERPFATTPRLAVTTATTATMPSWQKEGVWKERESQRQFSHWTLAQEQQQQQEQEQEQQQKQQQMQMQMHGWPAQDRDADRERMDQQPLAARYEEYNDHHQHQHYHQQPHHDNYHGSPVHRRSSQMMDDKDAPTRLTHSRAAAVSSPPPDLGAPQAPHQQAYQQQHQGPATVPTPDPIRPTTAVVVAAAAPRSHPSHWESSPHYPTTRSGASESAHPSMPHPSRPMSDSMPPATSSSMSSISPLAGPNSNRMRGFDAGVPSNENGSMRSRSSISEGVQPPHPPMLTSPPRGHSTATGGVPYQSQQPSPVLPPPPPPHLETHQAVVNTQAIHRPSHPFYIQHAQGHHHDGQSQQQQHHLSFSQQHQRQSYPPLQVQVPAPHPHPRHPPFHSQSPSSASSFQSPPSSGIASTAGNKRRSVADLLFVPVKSKERRSGSLSSPSSLEPSPSLWPPAASGSPYSSTHRQPSTLSHPNLPFPSPNGTVSGTAISGAPSVSAAAFTTSTKGAKNGSAPSTPRAGKGSSGPKTFQCTGYPGCNMVFTRSEHLARHERKHTGEKPFKCIVANCTRTFSRYDNMIQHTQTHSDRSKREVDVHRINPTHSAPGMASSVRIPGYGRGSSTIQKTYMHSGVVSGNMGSPSVLATEHPNGAGQWSSYGSPSMHGYYSPGPPSDPRATHSKSLSSLRGGADPGSPALGMNPRGLEERRQRKMETAIQTTSPGHPYQQSPLSSRQNSHAGREAATYDYHRQASISGRPPEGLASGAAVMAPRSTNGHSGPPAGPIGLGVSPLTPSSSHSQLPYVERLTPYEHEMLMEHRRSLVSTPDAASGASPSAWAPGSRGSASFGRGSSNFDEQQKLAHQQPLAQIHYLTGEEKERLREHRRSTPDLLFEPSSKRTSIDSTEVVSTQPLPSRDAKSGMQWFSQTGVPQINPSSATRVTEGTRPGSQESLGHPLLPPQPQPQPQTQPRAHSIPLPHPLTVSRLNGAPNVNSGTGTTLPASTSSAPSATASPNTVGSHISTSPGSVLPPIMGMQPSGPIAFSKQPPSPGLHSQRVPYSPAARLPPPLPKPGIHPFSRSNSFSHPSSHGATIHTSDDTDETSAHVASPLGKEARRGDIDTIRQSRTIIGHNDNRTQQNFRRPSSMNMLLTSTVRPRSIDCLSTAMLEMLTQDFAPVTRRHVDSRLHRMDERDYYQLKSIVSEKFAENLEAHPWFLNNLTALLCVVEVGNEDAHSHVLQHVKDGDEQDMATDFNSWSASRNPSLTFERISLGSTSRQRARSPGTNGIQGLTITPHEELPSFVALVKEQQPQRQQQSPSLLPDDQFVLGRFDLPAGAYCPKDAIIKNFDLSKDSSLWGLYRFQEYPGLCFVVLKSVIQEYTRMMAALQAGKCLFDEEPEDDGEEDVDMAVDDHGPATLKPKYRMALTLVESVEGELVPEEVLDAVGQFDWTLSGHGRRVRFSEQPPMGLSRSTKVWTRFDRLMCHPTESEILGRDYEMLPAYTCTAVQEDEDKSLKDESTDAVAARFVHSDSLAPAMVAFLWADIYKAYKESGQLYRWGTELPESEENVVDEDDKDGYQDEEDQMKEENVEATPLSRDVHGSERLDADVDDGADRLSMPDSFQRWRMARRSTTDSNSTSASRRDSVMPLLSLVMSAMSTATVAPSGDMTGSTAMSTEGEQQQKQQEEEEEEEEPPMTPTIRKDSGGSLTSAASSASATSATSSSVGRRISIAELCSPMLTLGNTTSISGHKASKLEHEN